MILIKKKKSHFKEMINTHCGDNPFDSESFIASLNNEEDAFSKICDLMGYLHDSSYFVTKKQKEFRNTLFDYYLPRLTPLLNAWKKDNHADNFNHSLIDYSHEEGGIEKNRILRQECIFVIYGLIVAGILQSKSIRHSMKCILKFLNINLELQSIQNKLCKIEKADIFKAYESVKKKIRESNYDRFS